MLKKLYDLVKEWDTMRLAEKVDSSNQRVLSSFGEFGINIAPIPILGANQSKLKFIESLERYALDMAYNSESYIQGIYSKLCGTILLDNSTWKWGKPTTVDHVITHEYTHYLFEKFMSIVEEKIRGYQNVRLDRLALPGTTKDIDPLEELKRYVESLQRERRTEDERRRLEFDIYFEEMFAESVALYLTGQINGDKKWVDYSKLHQGVVLRQDRQFTRRLEESLYNAFFERMYSRGLRQVVIELPVLYHLARSAFEKRYQKAIPEPTPK